MSRLQFVGTLLTERPSAIFTRGGVIRVWVTVVVAMSVGCFVVVSIAGSRTWHKPTFNEYDEQAHLDYALRVSQGELPRWGDRYTPETVRLLNCLGISQVVPPPCGHNKDPRQFPPDGYSYEAQQPPLGYLNYLPFLSRGAKPADALNSAREGSLFWLAVAAALLTVMAWFGNLSILQAVLLLTACLLNPTVIRAASTVTNDAAAVAAGAACVVVVQARRRLAMGLIRPIALATGLLVGLLKGLFLVAPLALLLAGLRGGSAMRATSVLRYLWTRRSCELCLLLGALASTVGFVVIQDARSSVPPGHVLHVLLGGQISRGFPWSTEWTSLQLAVASYLSTSPRPLYTIWNLLMYASAASVLLTNSVRNRRSPLGSLAAGTAVASATLALGYPVFFYVQGHYDFYTPARYFLPLLPLVAYLAARLINPISLVIVGIILPVAATTSGLVR